MSQQKIKYPIFFTLEHVENGYILTCKDENVGLNEESAYRKEVVTEDNIEKRIGKLLCLGALVKEHPLGFYIEATGVNTYAVEEMGNTSELIQAKTTYYHMLQKGAKDGEVICLIIDDTDTIEVYGYEAERMAVNLKITTKKSGGVQYLSFPNDKDGRKAMASCGITTKLASASHQKILQWVAEHPAKLENPVK
jgi:hypothetical protein